MKSKIPYLHHNDTIAIVAPSGKIAEESVFRAKEIFESWKLKVQLGSHLFKSYFGFSATQEQRLSDLQNALDDENIKAIICARGGYGLIQIIEDLDFTNFLKHPKWIAGFSDIGILINHLQQKYQMQSIHSCMPVSMENNTEESLKSLYNALFGENLQYAWNTDSYTRQGKAKAEICGGNLSIQYSLLASDSDVNTDGKILLIEEIGEYLYHIERMLYSLKRGGKLKGLAALLVGSFTDIKANNEEFGKNYQEIILSIVQEYDYPVIFGFPAGHQADNRALVMGLEAEVAATDEGCSFIQRLSGKQISPSENMIVNL